MFRYKIVVSFLVILFFSACSKQNKVNVDIAARVFINKLIIEDIYRNQPDSIKIKENKLFKKYHITKQDFINTISSYKSDREQWDVFFKKAKKYLDSLRALHPLR